MGDRVCIITGAASGIGKSAQELFSKHQYKCICVDKDEEKMEQLSSANIMPLRCDLLEDKGYQYLHDELSSILKTGDEITLINNIGGSIYRNQSQGICDWNSFERSLEYNLKPMVKMTEIILPFMMRSNIGKIVNVSSISARKELHTVGEEYSASKAAIIGFSRRLALRAAKSNILVNTVCPGIILTERIKKIWEDRDSDQNVNIIKMIPLGRCGTPDEIAKVIYFAGSSDNTFMTGAVIDVNGGMFMP